MEDSWKDLTKLWTLLNLDNRTPDGLNSFSQNSSHPEGVFFFFVHNLIYSNSVKDIPELNIRFKWLYV